MSESSGRRRGCRVLVVGSVPSVVPVFAVARFARLSRSFLWLSCVEYPFAFEAVAAVFLVCKKRTIAKKVFRRDPTTTQQQLLLLPSCKYNFLCQSTFAFPIRFWHKLRRHRQLVNDKPLLCVTRKHRNRSSRLKFKTLKPKTVCLALAGVRVSNMRP